MLEGCCINHVVDNLKGIYDPNIIKTARAVYCLRKNEILGKKEIDFQNITGLVDIFEANLVEIDHVVLSIFYRHFVKKTFFSSGAPKQTFSLKSQLLFYYDYYPFL